MDLVMLGRRACTKATPPTGGVHCICGGSGTHRAWGFLLRKKILAYFTLKHNPRGMTHAEIGEAPTQSADNPRLHTARTHTQRVSRKILRSSNQPTNTLCRIPVHFGPLCCPPTANMDACNPRLHAVLHSLSPRRAKIALPVG